MAQEPDIDIGAITEALNNKTDTDGENIAPTFPQGILQAGGVDTVVDFQSPSSANGYTWYRKYASGCVEQGSSTTRNVGETIYLPVEMADANYNATATMVILSTTAPMGPDIVRITRSATTIKIGDPNGWGGVQYIWQVCGMAAS